MKYTNSSSLLAHLTFSEKALSQLFKLFVSIAALMYVGFRLYAERDYFTLWLNQIQGEKILFTSITILLIPFNWGLEAQRWRKMMQTVYPKLSLPNALKAILAGIATGMFTPNRIGEYIGRMWAIPEANRVEAVTYTFLNRIYQMQVTLIMGTIAFEFMYHFEFQLLKSLFLSEGWKWIRYTLWGINILAWFGVLFPKWLSYLCLQFLPDFSWVKTAKQAVEVIDIKMLLYVIGLGILRYAVFSIQYYFLMLAFGYTGDITLGLAMIGLIFLIKSVIPFVSIAELGIRESVAITVMTLFAQTSFMAFSSTFILYIFNIILPALVGVIIIHQKNYK